MHNSDLWARSHDPAGTCAPDPHLRMISNMSMPVQHQTPSASFLLSLNRIVESRVNE